VALCGSNAKDRPVAAWDRKVRIGRKFSQKAPDLVSNTPHWSEISALFTLIVAFMPESVATTVVCAYGVGNRLLDGLEGPDRRYLSPS
jgi:hypothetical protein